MYLTWLNYEINYVSKDTIAKKKSNMCIWHIKKYDNFYLRRNQ